MEVLEYQQKFEVELSTFPDTANTKTPSKLVFSLTCVCLSVFAKKFVSGYPVSEHESLSGARGRKNLLTWVKTRLKYLP